MHLSVSLALYLSPFMLTINPSTPIVRLLPLLIVMRHLGSRVVILALDVERLLVDAAVEDRLITAEVFGHGVERSEHSLAKVFALLLLRNGHFFDVAAEPAVVDAV